MVLLPGLRSDGTLVEDVSALHGKGQALSTRDVVDTALQARECVRARVWTQRVWWGSPVSAARYPAGLPQADVPPHMCP